MHTCRHLDSHRRRIAKGFSLLELMVAILLLSALMAVAVNGMMEMQRRGNTEASKTDTVQETRDFIDQVVRDIHDAGYPPPRAVSWAASVTPLCVVQLNGASTINTTVANNTSPYVACGITNFSHTKVIYEGDLGDGSGVVSVVILDIQPNAAGNTTCPCILRRGVLQKSVWVTNNCNTNLTSANCTPQYFTEVNGVLNSGSGGTSTYGVTLSGPGTYTTYTTQDVFDAYDTGGTSIASCSLTTSPDCTAIRSLQITVNVAPTYDDMTVQTYPVFSITSKARLNF